MKKTALIISTLCFVVAMSCFAIFKLTEKMNHDTLMANSEVRAHTWLVYFSNKLGGFEDVIAANEVTEEQIAILDDAREFVDVFRFKLFNADGALLIISDDLHVGDNSQPLNGEINQTAMSVIRIKHKKQKLMTAEKKITGLIIMLKLTTL